MKSGLVLLALAVSPAMAQQQADVRRAQEAYAGADFPGAILAARRALTRTLTRADRIIVFEVLGYAYSALDSLLPARGAFRELIFLDPNREPDRTVVSSRVVSNYQTALGEVLVVRRAAIDSATFVAGQGRTAIRYEVTRSSRVTTRISGAAVDLPLDTRLAVGETRVEWDGLNRDGMPVPPGRYQIVVNATEGQNEFAATIPLTVGHGPVDTLAHLFALPGYTEQPETVRPPRDWKPLGISALIAGVAAGASFALGHADLPGEKRREIGGVSLLTLGVGLFVSLQRPDPQPVEANIRYNQLLREQLAQRNAQIAGENTLRRRQVLLSIVPGAGQ